MAGALFFGYQKIILCKFGKRNVLFVCQRVFRPRYENQIFFAVCNSCGNAGATQYGGNSVIFDPWGEVLSVAGESEEIITAECDMQISAGIRKSINVFCDRRADIY